MTAASAFWVAGVMATASAFVLVSVLAACKLKPRTGKMTSNVLSITRLQHAPFTRWTQAPDKPGDAGVAMIFRAVEERGAPQRCIIKYILTIHWLYHLMALLFGT